jgi:transcriptional regulator with XRE-family HTH domain
VPRKVKPESFAARLRRLRLAAGLSAADLSAAAGLTRQALHKLESGSVPSLPTAQRLAAALGVPLADLAG